MENDKRIVAADMKTHPFFNTFDVQASTHVFEYEVDFKLVEYCVNHSFWGDNRSLRSPEHVKQLIAGIKAPGYRSFHIDIDFVGQITSKGEKYHKVEARIKNQVGNVFPLIEEFVYIGTKTTNLTMLPNQAGHKKYSDARILHIPLHSNENTEKIGLFQLEEILKLAQGKYPGKDPLEKGKMFLAEFYRPEFKFYPQ